MWAGLPVVTAPGEVHVSRVAAALAMSEGAQPLVARSLDDYLSLVVALLRAPLDPTALILREARQLRHPAHVA